MAVRHATAADLPAITAIYAHEVEHGTASYETSAPGLAEMERRWRSLTGEGYAFLVAKSDGVVAGYAYASPYRARAGYAWTVENSVYIHSACRGRGVGRRLLQALIDHCTQAGFRQMIAVIGDGSNAASIGLHEALAFRVAARFPGIGWKHGRWLDGVQMMRSLGHGCATSPGAPPLPLRE